MEWIILGVILLLTAIKVPIGYALSLATIFAILWTGAVSLSVVPLNLFSGASSFPLLAIPLFILAGGLMETSGISQRLVNLAQSLVFGVTLAVDLFGPPSLLVELRRAESTAATEGLADLRGAGNLATIPGGHGTEYGIPIPRSRSPTRPPPGSTPASPRARTSSRS